MKKKYNIPLLTGIRYAKIGVIIIMLIGFIWIIYFLYQNLYLPLTQAQVVGELKAKVALETVNKKDLEDLLKVMENNKKLPLIDWDTIADPFVKQHLTINLPPPASEAENNAAPASNASPP